MRLIKFCLILILCTAVYTGFAQKHNKENLSYDRISPLEINDLPKAEFNLKSMLRQDIPINSTQFEIETFQPFHLAQLLYQHLQIKFDPRTQLPFFIKGTPKNLNTNLSPEAQAWNYLQVISQSLQIEKTDEEFELISLKTDILGQKHFTFSQSFNGIPVYGSEVKLHSDNGVIHLFNGRNFPTPKGIDTTPTINPMEAVSSIRENLGYEIEISIDPIFEFLQDDEVVFSELVIYHKSLNPKNPRLAYAIKFNPNLKDRWQVFVDAHTGEIIESYNRTCLFHPHSDHLKEHNCHSHKQNTTTYSNHSNLEVGPEITSANDLLGQSRTINTFEEGGTYYMLDASRSSMFNASQSNMPDDPIGTIWTIDATDNNVESNDFSLNHVFDNDNNWNNPTGVSAHYNGGKAFEYFKDTHNRNSINGSGGNIVSIINVQDNNGPMDNAFWNGTAIFYGNGSQAFMPLARGLDVAGHEMSHGVIQETANLEYIGESGALNESYADVFGAMIDRNDWKIGEDVVLSSAFPSGALRDMQNPNQGGSSLNFPGYQPDHTDDQYTGNQDNGGVHINSGIPNKAYYLFATEIGKDKAEQIYYHALDNYLVRASQFIDMRASIEQSAEDLYENFEVEAASNAFAAVGIGPGGGTGGNAGGGSGQDDFQPNPGDDYVVLTDADNNQVYLFSADQNPIQNPLTAVSPINKISVTDDGGAMVYVANDKRIRAIIYDWSNNTFDEFDLFNDPIFTNVAVSKDGARIAALTDDNDDRVWVYDFTLEDWQDFQLYNPTYSDGIETGDVVYADILEWDFTGQNIMYDAFNKIDGNFGDDIEYWDIGFVNVFNRDAIQFTEGQVAKLFSGLPENVSVGNPTFSKNSDYIISFDFLNDFNGDVEIKGANIQTGELGTIFTQSILGIPNYNPDDNRIVFDAETDSGQRVLAFIDLENDKINGSGSASIFLEGGHQGIWFANGERVISNQNINNIENDFKVDPNPFITEIKLQFRSHLKQEIEIALFNTTGKQVYNKSISTVLGENIFQISFPPSLPKGVYILQVTGRAGTWSHKLIKK